MKLNQPKEGREMVGDLTPMIDIVFLLIIFFMTVASLLSEQKIPVAIPIAAAASIAEEQSGRFIMSINENGEIFAGMRMVTAEQIPAVIADNKDFFPDFRVFLRADANTPHRFVREVLEGIAAAEVYDVIFATFQSEPGS